jgi:hypothetical protein
VFMFIYIVCIRKHNEIHRSALKVKWNPRRIKSSPGCSRFQYHIHNLGSNYHLVARSGSSSVLNTLPT